MAVRAPSVKFATRQSLQMGSDTNVIIAEPGRVLAVVARSLSSPTR